MSEPILEVKTVVSMPFGENTFVAHLRGRTDCLIVDPGFEPEKIIELVENDRLEPAAILNTHGHPDHIAGNQAMKDRWPDCPLVIGRDEAPMLTDARLNMSAALGFSIISPPADILLTEGQTYEAAGMSFEIFEIPGHSAGHIVFVWKGGRPYYIFGGDVLFAGSIGRTDFPGGSFEELASGIHRKLFNLPDDSIVLPGHGDPTTIGEERRSNPYVGEAAGQPPLM